MFHPVKHFYDFGSFRFDPERRRLLRNGELVLLPPKAMDALTFLIKHPGELLEREDLMQAVWGDTFVEDANLTVAISHVRKALGQNGGKAEYIETIPRVGYRFTAEVREVRQEAAPLIVEKHTLSKTVIEEEVEDRPPSVTLTTTRALPGINALSALSTRTQVGLGAICVLLAVALTVVYFRRGEDRRAVLTASVVPTIHSLAVLPPKSVTNEADNDSLSLGIADALITRLGSLSKLIVRPTSAVTRYIGAQENSVDVGRALNVDAVLEGTVQRSNGRMKVTLRLVEVESGAQVWAGTFDEPDGDVFKLQDSMSQQVAQVLSQELTDSDRILLTKRQTQNVDAYALYLKGNYFWNKRGAEVEKSIEYFRKAIALDPNFAQAYVGLANVYAVTLTRSPEAETLVEKALRLDSTLAEAHATHGFIRMFHHWDWVEAEKALDHAIALNPNLPIGHHWKGVYLSLRGRLDEAKAEMHQALELDPLSLIISADIAQLHYFAHEYDQAESQCRKVLELDPNFMVAHLYLFYIYQLEGKTVEARKAGLAVRRLAGAPAEEFVLNQAASYAMAGNNDKAIASLERAWAGHVFLLPYINVDPLFDGLRSDPRFVDLLRRLNSSSDARASSV